MKNFVKISIIILMLLAVFGDATAMGKQNKSRIGSDREARDFSLYDIEGKKVTLSEFKNKNNVVLFFWATWCMFCRAEIKNLNNMYDELAKNEIVVLGIDVDESSKAVKNFLVKNKMKFKILLDKESGVALNYELVGVPTYVIIDKAGIVKFSGHQFPQNYLELISK